jgi:hypothetical protein
MDLDSVDVIKLCLSHIVAKLVLDTYSPIVIELAPKINMIGLLNPQVVAGGKSMQHSSLSVVVRHWPRTFHSEVENVDTVFGDYHEIFVFS